MEARNRPLHEWFHRIESGQLRLPRFQRFESWGHGEIASLVEAVLNGLPTGATLILEMGSEEPFVSRLMAGAPDARERPTEHLLDGQQRLTALWRSLHDDYSTRTYLVTFEEDAELGGPTVPVVRSQARWERNGTRYPVWVDDPVQLNERGFIPLSLLLPGESQDDVGEWCDLATEGDTSASRALERSVVPLRESVRTYNIPFLALPSHTPRHVALNVFIKLNTSSVRLSAFDIVVAQFEARTGTSLHELVGELHSEVPQAEHYSDASDLVLDVAALREDRSATNASYFRLDLDRLDNERDDVIAGVRWMVDLLESERVFDAARLPTLSILPVLGALHQFMPEALDDRGNAMTLIRKYLWRSFLTRRYDNAAATRALQDFRGLRDQLRGDRDAVVPIFDEEQYPLPSKDELKRAGWPKTKDILARGIVAVCLRAGGYDIADASVVSREHLARREYHHLFPRSLLVNDGGIPDSHTMRALNCALVTWSTNRNISAKDPITYLKERAERAGLGESEIIERLASHLIPYEELNVGGYAQVVDAAEREGRVRDDYEAFLDARAGLIAMRITELCDGRHPA